MPLTDMQVEECVKSLRRFIDLDEPKRSKVAHKLTLCMMGDPLFVRMLNIVIDKEEEQEVE